MFGLLLLLVAVACYCYCLFLCDPDFFLLCVAGKCVTDKTKHRDIKYADRAEAQKLINDKRFRTVNELTPELFEIDMAKNVIRLDLPQQIGYFVYQYAKLRMLQFYYDFMDVFVDRRDFQYVQMDTDSSYIAISGNTLEDVIKPHMKEQFYRDYDKWLPAVACDTHQPEFVNGRTNFSGACCVSRQKFDKRTPGLFKLEWCGRGFVGLCSKTYYCYGDTDKASCKGINKRQNELNKDKFMQVLNEQKAGAGVNRGFRVMNNRMYTYTQIRHGLSYFYPKRKVAADGMTTEPLDV